MILDLPPGSSDVSLTGIQSTPLRGVVVVTSPQGLAGMVFRKSAQMAEKLNVPVIGLVENMSYAECRKCGVRLEVFGPSQAISTAELLGIPLLGRLPLDPELAMRCDNGRVDEQHTELFDSVVDEVLVRVPEEKCKLVFDK